MPKIGKTETVQVSLYLPPLLHAKLVKYARMHKRSLNQEVIWILEKYLDMEDQKEVQHESTVIKEPSISL